ncbi:methyltransferase [Nonomuraea sp. NPDC059007]|uniref:methyltransferase n=1 Tax=Nonomuraea sp. NPDC059007 TaxID=3346692 RepID=UPI0036B75B22
MKITDHLADGPRTVAEVARATGAHESSLARYLRLCAMHGLVTKTDNGGYALTEVGHLLRSDVPSLRGFVIAVNGPGMTRCWEDVPAVLRTGEPTSREKWGLEHWQYYEEHPEEARSHAEGLHMMSVEMADGIAASYDFSRFVTIADIGGSPGTLLARALRAAPKARGILLDLPGAIIHARELMESTERVEFVSGDFLDTVPADCDLYLLKHILLDLDDDRAARLLENCYKAAAPGSSLLVVDWVMTSEPSFVHAMDVECMVLSGGRVRTTDELIALLADAGYTRIAERPLQGFERVPARVIEAVRP